LLLLDERSESSLLAERRDDVGALAADGLALDAGFGAGGRASLGTTDSLTVVAMGLSRSLVVAKGGGALVLRSVLSGSSGSFAGAIGVF
jgi:hypothetical protein